MFYHLEIMIDIDMDNLASANYVLGKPMDFHIQVQIACFCLSEIPIFSGFWLLQSEFSTLIEPTLALFAFTRFITKVTTIYSHLAESSQLTT